MSSLLLDTKRYSNQSGIATGGCAEPSSRPTGNAGPVSDLVVWTRNLQAPFLQHGQFRIVVCAGKHGEDEGTVGTILQSDRGSKTT